MNFNQFKLDLVSSSPNWEENTISLFNRVNSLELVFRCRVYVLNARNDQRCVEEENNGQRNVDLFFLLQQYKQSD